MTLKNILILFGLSVPFVTSAQRADTRIGTLMNEDRWFDVARELETTPVDSFNPTLRQMAVAMTHYHFNRSDSACMVLADLLNNHQQELGNNTLNMALLMAKSLARTDRYAEAAGLMQDLYDQLSAQGIDSMQTRGYRAQAQYWKVLAANGPICKPLHAVGEYHIPMCVDKQVGQRALFMNGTINGKENRLLFDTGAGVCVVSSQQARYHGLRLLDVTSPMSGIGVQQGRYAIADTLRIGEMVWLNVPFLVVDVQTGHAVADSIGRQLPPVIGVPIMLRMQEVQLDFARREFVIPAVPTPNPLKSCNLIRTDGEVLQLNSIDEKGNPLRFHFDTGCYYTTLSSAWYARHQAMTEAVGIPDTFRLAGVGGAIINRSFRLPNVRFRIGNGLACLDSVSVDTGIDLRSGQPRQTYGFTNHEDGTVGLDLLERFRRVILNLKEMYLEAIP